MRFLLLTTTALTLLTPAVSIAGALPCDLDLPEVCRREYTKLKKQRKTAIANLTMAREVTVDAWEKPAGHLHHESPDLSQAHKDLREIFEDYKELRLLRRKTKNRNVRKVIDSQMEDLELRAEHSARTLLTFRHSMTVKISPNKGIEIKAKAEKTIGLRSTEFKELKVHVPNIRSRPISITYSLKHEKRGTLLSADRTTLIEEDVHVMSHIQEGKMEFVRIERMEQAYGKKRLNRSQYFDRGTRGAERELKEIDKKLAVFREDPELLEYVSDLVEMPDKEF